APRPGWPRFEGADLRQALKASRVAVGLLDHHRVGTPPGLGDDELRELGEARRGELRNSRPEHSGTAAAQVAGDIPLRHRHPFTPCYILPRPPNAAVRRLPDTSQSLRLA